MYVPQNKINAATKINFAGQCKKYANAALLQSYFLHMCNSYNKIKQNYNFTAARILFYFIAHETTLKTTYPSLSPHPQ